jgi:hypothetical protein
VGLRASARLATSRQPEDIMDDKQPPATPPGPPPPPYYPPYAPMNTYAILSLVFGVMVFPPLGIYFGNRAKREIAQTGERGAELATAGIVVGWVFTIMYVVFLVIWCALAGSLLTGAGTA